MFEFLFKKAEADNSQKESVQVSYLEDFSEFFHYIEKSLGIGSLFEKSIVKSKLQRVAKKYKIETNREFIEHFSKKGDLYSEVIDAVTVNETYFFRELDTLEWVVSQIQKSSKSHRILSIPSSKGAEIYSLYILLMQKAPQSILQQYFMGIDIDKEALKQAKRGIFSEHELHRLESELKCRYFQKEDLGYQIIDSIRLNVDFAEDNILSLTSGKYGYFDIVLCRNLFIYFEDQYILEALKHLHQIVADDGYLVLGVADRMVEQHYFKKVNNFIYQKQN